MYDTSYAKKLVKMLKKERKDEIADKLSRAIAEYERGMMAIHVLSGYVQEAESIIFR